MAFSVCQTWCSALSYSPDMLSAELTRLPVLLTFCCWCHLVQLQLYLPPSLAKILVLEQNQESKLWKSTSFSFLLDISSFLF